MTPRDNRPRRPDGKEPFYWSKRWQRVRKQVLKEAHHECQECKKRGVLSRATIVHHHLPRKDYPEWELTHYLPDGTPQLIALCFDCHERIETERGNRTRAKEPLTEEWWG